MNCLTYLQKCFLIVALLKDLSWEKQNYVMYIATHDIAPHFKHLSKDNLNKSEVMVYSFDESLNEITQTCEMDLIVRYWNNDAQKVDVRYWGSSFFGHATPRNLLKQFNKITGELDPKKLY